VSRYLRLEAKRAALAEILIHFLSLSILSVSSFVGEAVRLSGEYLPIDYGPRGKGFQSIVRRFPIGPVSMVSPWNFPLNLVAHKVRGFTNPAI
jgi:acyl-CoA reductase-like NAD-dependent aldehyde dehydrogenase